MHFLFKIIRIRQKTLSYTLQNALFCNAELGKLIPKDKANMLFEHFNCGYFNTQTDRQKQLIEEFKQIRLQYGDPTKWKILKALARTKKHTRSVYPPGWQIV